MDQLVAEIEFVNPEPELLKLTKPRNAKAKHSMTEMTGPTIDS